MSVEIFIIAFIICALGYYLVYLPIRNGAGINIASDESKGKIVQDLENMFIFISPTHVGTIKIACMLVLGSILYIVTYAMPAPAPYIFLCLGTAMGYFVPEVVIAIMKKKRRAAFAEQLVDGLVLLSNGLRAGFTLQQALEMLSEECEPPISQEVELILREYRLGMDLNQAMQRSSDRMEDDDFELAVVAVTIARQLGGNLSEIFDRIVTTVRDRKILAGKVDAMTSQGRIQALVVGCLPYAFAVAVTKVNPELMQLMWTTLPGVGLMLAVVVMDTVGYLWVLKTAQVEY